MKRRSLWAFFSIPALALLAACAGGAAYWDSAAEHPVELDRGRPTCTRCHDEKEPIAYGRFDHLSQWLDMHKLRAYGQEQVCVMCHARSFCSDCHVTETELKPSIRRQSATYREMMHRGDYVSRHRIDARIDPTSCFRCHGNPKSSRSCAPCHG